MKKVVLIILFAGLTAVSYAQANLNTAQRNFQSSIVERINAMGLRVSVNSSDVIEFERQGVTYKVDIKSGNSAPFVVSIYREPIMGSINRERAQRAANQVNAEFKGIKVYSTNNVVIVATEQSVNNNEEFGYIMFASFDIILGAETKFKELYR